MKGSNFFNLASFEAPDRQRKMAYLIGAVGLILSIMVMPNAAAPLRKIPAFVSIYVSTILLISLLTSYLLYKHFCTTGYRPLLILSATYAYIAAISILHLLTFPGVLAPNGLVGAGEQTALWIWVMWHGGFPVGVLVYIWSFWMYQRKLPEKRLNRYASLSLYAAVLFLVLVIFFATTRFHRVLPVIIKNGLYTNDMKYIVGPFILICHFTVILLLWRMKQMRTILHVSLTLSVFMSLLDVIVTLFGEGRYTVGWYTARLNTVVSSSIISITFVYELNKLSDILAEQYQRFQSLFHYNLDAVYSLDIDGHVIGSNEMGKKLIGYAEAELLGVSLFQFVLPDDQKRARAATQKVLQGEPQHFETQAIHRDGYIVEVSVMAVPIFVDGTIMGAFCIARDVTAQKTAQKKLEEANRILHELSLRDGLTGLGNRRYLEDYLKETWNACLQKQQPLSVILMDIDNFKAYNDEYGHAMGDRCLQAIANVLQERIHPAIGLACRYGGEELCVILSGIDEMHAHEIAEAIRSGVEQLQMLHRRSEYGIVTVSVGLVSRIPSEETSPPTFLEMADQALYRCKGAGKNCVSSFENGQMMVKRRGRVL